MTGQHTKAQTRKTPQQRDSNMVTKKLRRAVEREGLTAEAARENNLEVENEKKVLERLTALRSAGPSTLIERPIGAFLPRTLI